MWETAKEQNREALSIRCIDGASLDHHTPGGRALLLVSSARPPGV